MNGVVNTFPEFLSAQSMTDPEVDACNPHPVTDISSIMDSSSADKFRR